MKPKTTKTGKIWRRLSLTFVTVCVAMLVVTYLFCRDIMKAEVHMRYVGIMNVASQKIAKTVSGMEMNAMNVFDEVGKHMENPDAVIAALDSKTGLNPDIRGYFAAFEPDYFPQMGRWFEPYVHQPDSTGTFEVRQVGSARHDYARSDWYVRAKKSNDSFWSYPYYYYDGTSISGHYCTFSNYEYLGYTIPLGERLSLTPMAGVLHSWLFDQDADMAAGCYLTIKHWNIYLWGNDLLKSHPRIVLGVDCTL